jgi:hypothetical protein
MAFLKHQEAKLPYLAILYPLALRLKGLYNLPLISNITSD